MSRESRILQILDSSLDAVVTIDSNGKVVHWNDQAERIFGWSRSEVSGKKLSELIIPEKFVQQHEQGMKHYMKTGEGPVIGRRIEIEAQDRAGEIFPIELSISAVRVDNDAAGFTGFIRDLRGLKDRECQLRLYDERVRKIVDSSQDGFWDIQMSRVGSALSDRCSTMLGYPAGYLSEVPPHESEMLHPQDRAKVESAWSAMLSGESKEYRVEYRMRDFENEWRNVRDKGEVVELDLNGKPSRVMGTRSEVTSEGGSATQSVESLGIVASGFAHDLNNILAVIGGHASLMSESPSLPVELCDNVNTIQLSVARLRSLVENMMSLGKPADYRLTEINIGSSIASIISLIRPSLGSDFQIQFNNDLGPEALVLADPTLLQQALINLILNSEDFTDGDGRVVISLSGFTENELSWAKIVVADTGNGIDSKVIDRIFEPFYTTKDTGRGFGIGLSVVKAFADKVSGRVTVANSAEGGGAIFTLEIPLASQPSCAFEAGTVNDSATVADVILVEDHDMLRPMIAETISLAGYRVRSFSGFESVISDEAIINGEFGVLVVDINLKDGVGTELVSLLEKRLSRRLPVLFTTGGSDEVDLGDLLPHQKILLKPFGIEELSNAIRELSGFKPSG
jgi:PAS domain S-box-containing protein